jgi:hypothetical protein
MTQLVRFDAGPARINPLEVEAPELIAWIEGKDPVAIDSWNDIGADEYARSFTAARTVGYDIVRDLYQGFLDTMKQPGATSDDFVQRMFPLLREKGWLPGLGGDQQAMRLLLIFNTNLRTAQAVGQWGRIQRVKAAMPYLQGFTARDMRVRHPPKSPVSDHRAYEGILLPVDHPFWQAYFPPLGFRCRCQVRQLTRSQVARKGLSVTTEADLAERISRLGQPWGFNPGLRPMQPVEEMAERTNADRLEGLPPIEPARERQLGSAVWKNLAGQALLATTVDALLSQLFG